MKSIQILSGAMLLATCWAWPLSNVAMESAQVDQPALDSSGAMNQAKDTQKLDMNKVKEMAELQMLGDANMVQNDKRAMLEVVSTMDAQDSVNQEAMTHERRNEDGTQDQVRPKTWPSLNVFNGAEGSKRDVAELNKAGDNAVAQDAVETADAATMQNVNKQGLVDDVMMTAKGQVE